MFCEPLFDEYRENLLECRHYGVAAVAGEEGLRFSVGDASTPVWYRSASKPLQALPLLVRGLDKKYGLTDEEVAVMCASHMGDDEHVRVISSILEKAGLSEDDMCMKPTYPLRTERHDELLRKNMPPRRIYHNCSGKHSGLMILSRDTGDGVENYYKRGTKAQDEILSMIELFSDIPRENIAVGTDGCGVPVYAVPIYNMALSYLRLACPDLIGNEAAKAAAIRAYDCIHRHPTMIAGADKECSILSSDPNLIVKLGAQGTVCIGIKSMRLGAAVKIIDGSGAEIAAAALRVLELLGYESEATRLCREKHPDTIINDTGAVVGHREAVFTF